MGKCKKHYHVLVGLLGGYLPNQNLGPFRNKRYAEQSAVELARLFRDQGLKVRGNAKAGYYLVGDFGEEYIEITRCYEKECLEDEEEYSHDISHFEPGDFWTILTGFLSDIANGEYVVEEIRDTAAWLLDEADKRRGDL